MASGDIMADIDVWEGVIPSSNGPQQGMRNGHRTMDFDASTAENCRYKRVLPPNYGGGGLTVLIRWMGATATSGATKWNVAVERDDVAGQDLDSDSFASANTTTTTTNASSGVMAETSVAFTSGAQMDSVAAGDVYRLDVKRDAADVADTMTGDAQIARIIVKET